MALFLSGAETRNVRAQAGILLPRNKPDHTNSKKKLSLRNLKQEYNVGITTGLIWRLFGRLRSQRVSTAERLTDAHINLTFSDLIVSYQA